MYILVHLKYRLFLSDSNKTRVFSIYFYRNPHITYSMKIRLVGTELLPADRRTDRQTHFFAILQTRLIHEVKRQILPRSVRSDATPTIKQSATRPTSENTRKILPRKLSIQKVYQKSHGACHLRKL